MSYLGFLAGLGLCTAIVFIRMHTRHAFHIPGSLIGDLCATFWFPWCALSQITTHIAAFDSIAQPINTTLEAYPTQSTIV